MTIRNFIFHIFLLSYIASWLSSSPLCSRAFVTSLKSKGNICISLVKMQTKQIRKWNKNMMNNICSSAYVVNFERISRDIDLCILLVQKCQKIQIASNIPSREYLKMKTKLFNIIVLCETIGEVNRDFAAHGNCSACCNKLKGRFRRIYRALWHLATRQREICSSILNQFDSYVSGL